MVTVRYDGSAMPDHLRKGMIFESATLVHGEEIEVSDTLAGAMIVSYPEAIKVTKGTPEPYVRMTGADRRSILLESERVERFGLDPARVLVGVPTLTAGQKKASAVEVNAGKWDTVLGPLAMWAQLDGQSDVAAACVRRAEALRTPKK